MPINLDGYEALRLLRAFFVEGSFAPESFVDGEISGRIRGEGRVLPCRPSSLTRLGRAAKINTPTDELTELTEPLQNPSRGVLSVLSVHISPFKIISRISDRRPKVLHCGTSPLAIAGFSKICGEGGCPPSALTAPWWRRIHPALTKASAARCTVSALPNPNQPCR
jgi:hypothetical protein